MSWQSNKVKLTVYAPKFSLALPDKEPLSCRGGDKAIGYTFDNFRVYPMISLTLVFITILVLAALSVAALNYTPWWAPRAQLAHEVAADGLMRLDRAYTLAASQSSSETGPAPTSDPDGGLRATLQPYYGFLPAAPRGMQWAYGLQSQAGPFQGMHYFCLYGAAVGEGEVLGVQRLSDTLGTMQAQLGSSCGTAGPAPNAYPAALALTYYVAYVPEVK